MVACLWDIWVSYVTQHRYFLLNPNFKQHVSGGEEWGITLSEMHFYQRHIWQSVTCSVYFWVTHCSYSTLSIFAGGNSNRKLPHPHKHTAWYTSQSASPRTRITLLPESDSADNGLYIEAACRDLQHFPTFLSPLWENMEGPVPVVYTAGSMERIA